MSFCTSTAGQLLTTLAFTPDRIKVPLACVRAPDGDVSKHRYSLVSDLGRAELAGSDGGRHLSRYLPRDPF